MASSLKASHQMVDSCEYHSGPSVSIKGKGISQYAEWLLGKWILLHVISYMLLIKT
jgi:hypothetical protein